MGKSRLLRELARHAASLPGTRVTWLTGQCPPFGENVTYAALADIVRSWAGLTGADDPATIRDRLRERLGHLADPHAVRLAEALGPLVGVSGERLTSAETEAAWRRFLLTLAATGPTVLVFEDMHWADEAMLSFVEQLGAAARNVPLLVVATARPELRERHPAWTGTISGAMSISVPPMHDGDIDTLYSLLLGQATLPQDARAPLIEFADGNPLYAQEYARMLLDGGLAERTAGLALVDPAGGAEMPRTVQAVIANRLDLLDPADRAVLQAASVVGVQFWAAPVALALGRPAEWVERALHHLQRRDLVYELPVSTMPGQAEYRFRHVLVRDVCYQRLPRAERVARHQRTADWLEQLADGRQHDLAEVLANHRWAAHEIARTVGLDQTPHAAATRSALHRAARRAYDLHALETAATLVDRALSVECGPDPALELFQAELAFYRDRDGFLDGGGTALLTTLAGRLAGAGDRPGAAKAWRLLATAAFARADRSELMRCLDRAIGLHATLPDSEDKVGVLLELARAHMLDAETEPACVAARTAAELAERLELREARANARITLAVVRYQAGAEEAYAELADVTEECRVERLTSRRRAVHNLAWVLQEEGDLTGSARLVDEQRSLDLAGEHALTVSFSDQWARSYYSGDWTSALRMAEGSTRRPTDEWDLHIVAVSGWIRALGDDPAGPGTGEDLVDQALVAARRSGFQRVLRSTLAHAALCRAVQGRRDEAMALLTELDEDWRQTKMIPFAEWVPAVGHVAALLGGDAAVLVRDLLAHAPRVTRWAREAGRSAEAALARGDGDAARAGRLLTSAAEGYAEMTDVTDQMIASALAVGPLTEADPPAAAATLARVRAFAGRHAATGLLRIAGAG